MFKKISGLVVMLLVAGMVAVQSAMAAAWIDVSSVAVETGPVATLGLTILGGLSAMWVLRKLIKTINRS